MYGEIYKAWKAEKTTTMPQPLASDFYNHAAAFLKSLDDELATADTTTPHRRLLAMEREMVKRLLDELKQTRFHKIALGAQGLIPVQPNELMEDEVAMLTIVKEAFSSLNLKREDLRRTTEENEGADALKIVRFLQDIPEIVGVDLKIYGPFKKEDVASLPSANGQALERQGAVKVIEAKGVS
jgi:DNA replication factor GINS